MPETLVKARNGRMVKRKIPSPANSAAVTSFASMRQQLKDEVEAETSRCLLLATAAAAWVSASRPELTFGADPIFIRIAAPDSGSLGEFEGYGKKGNAVLIRDCQAGQIWWCDPEGRDSYSSRFAFRLGPVLPVRFEIVFLKP